MKQYIVDAFTDKIFSGNQAAVCIMNSWPDEKLMIDIARENNFSETAFTVKDLKHYKLRWFTPGGEVDLCGHATLATAFVLMNFYEDSHRIIFDTMSGPLTVRRDKDELYYMDFPLYELKSVPVTNEICDALGGMTPEYAFMGRDLVCVLKDSDSVKNCQPDLEKVKQLDGLLLHITAQGHDNIDCVSRSFAPKLKINEDPVCGSGHCHIVPYWAEKLHKNQITAYQASQRGGYLYCSIENERISISGKAALFAEAKIFCD
ncbi:MAG: PhzF family phenazine biosynthesis protein [Synergistaceae bacterium]|nr:PhzF family phenazine biosynthesis protein [Synergistaceae bacterium]